MAFLKEKVSYLRQHAFVRNVATLQLGSFFGNIFQAAIGILIARLLQPELFGIYSLAFGLASLASVFLGVGAQDAVVTVLGSAYTRKDRGEIGEALAFLLKITVITGSIALLFAFLSPWIAQRFYNDSSIGIYATIIIMASIFSTSFYSLSLVGLQVVGKIKTMTALILSDQITRYTISLLMVLAGWGILGAASGHLMGAVLIFVASIFIWENLRRNFTLFPSLRSLMGQARRVGLKKYLGFSFWIALDRNIANLYSALPVLLTGLYLTTADVSYFKLAFGFVNLALSLLGPISVLLAVEFPKMNTEDSGKLRTNFLRVSLFSVGLSTLLTAGALVTSPLVFKHLYGVSFLPSTQYVFGLLVYGALFGIGVGLGPMWRTIHKVKISILINIVTLGAGIPLGLYLIKNFDLWGTVAMVTIWYTVSHFASFIYLQNKLKHLTP